MKDVGRKMGARGLPLEAADGQEVQDKLGAQA